MKMKQEHYNAILNSFRPHVETIKKHKEHIKNNAKYQDLEKRVGFDCWSAFVPNDIKTVIRKEEYKDEHLSTSFKKAFKELGI